MTKQEMASRVLQKLKVLENGEDIDPNDESIIVSAYDAAYALLTINKLVTWGSEDEIPLQAELPIIDYVANRIKLSFSTPIDVSQSLPFEAAQAEKDLFSITQADYVPDVVPALYY